MRAVLQEGHSDASSTEWMATVQRQCEQMLGAHPRGELARILDNVKTALDTWQRVWPRLGRDREFRLAIAREARLWAKRIAELAPASSRR